MLRGSVGEGGDEVSVARFIADQRTSYRVPYAVCCAILGVSQSWFYKWLNRPPTAGQRRRAELDAAVLKMFDAKRRADCQTWRRTLSRASVASLMTWKGSKQ